MTALRQPLPGVLTFAPGDLVRVVFDYIDLGPGYGEKVERTRLARVKSEPILDESGAWVVPVAGEVNPVPAGLVKHA